MLELAGWEVLPEGPRLEDSSVQKVLCLPPGGVPGCCSRPQLSGTPALRLLVGLSQWARGLQEAGVGRRWRYLPQLPPCCGGQSGALL